MTISTTGPSARRLPACAAQAAFTLLELILVMVIIGTLLGLAAPSLRGFFASRQTADAAAQLVALLQFARAQAATEGRAYRLNLDLHGGKYWLTAQDQGTFRNLATEFGRTFLLPEGARVEWVAPAADAPPDHITFQPTGRNEAVTFRLTGRQGEVYEVTCPSPTEMFRVVVPEEGPSP